MDFDYTNYRNFGWGGAFLNEIESARFSQKWVVDGMKIRCRGAHFPEGNDLTLVTSGTELIGIRNKERWTLAGKPTLTNSLSL